MLATPSSGGADAGVGGGGCIGSLLAPRTVRRDAQTMPMTACVYSQQTEPDWRNKLEWGTRDGV